MLGQIKTDDKSNEITAIPELIKTLALEGAIITIDAIGCQKKITRTIIEEKADYVLQVKNNQQRLHEDIALFFQDTENGAFDTCETIDGDHGRIETRQYVTTSDIDWLPGKRLWAGIKTIVMKVQPSSTYTSISLTIHKRLGGASNPQDQILASGALTIRTNVPNGKIQTDLSILGFMVGIVVGTAVLRAHKKGLTIPCEPFSM